MSDEYVKEILNKCVAQLCKKSRISSLSQHSLNCMTDIIINYIKKIAKDYTSLIEDKPNQQQQQQLITSLIFPHNYKRKKELRIFRILLDNCKNDVKFSYLPPCIPYPIPSLFETPSNIYPEITKRKRKRESFVDECWGDNNKDSKLFQVSKPTVYKPQFATANRIQKKNEKKEKENGKPP